MASTTLAPTSSLRLRRSYFRVGLYLLSVALLVWLPFQNGAVAVLVASGVLPPSLGQAMILAKELVLIGLLAAVVLTGRPRHWQWVDSVLLIYILWCALYLPRGGLPLMARVTGIRMLILPVLVYFLGRFVPVPRNGLAAIWGVFLVAYTTIAVVGLVEYFLVSQEQMATLQLAVQQTKGNLDTSQEALIAELGGLFYSAFRAADGSLMWIRRMMSTYMEPLALGHALILPLLFLFTNFVNPRAAVLRPRWLTGVLLILLGAAQVLSLSRGAVLATLVGFSAVGLILRRTRIRSFVLILFIILGALAVPAVRNYVAATLSLDDPSASGHVYYFQKGLESIAQHPLGEGLGQSGYVEYQYATDSASFETKNEGFYFSVAGQVGLIGLGLFGLGTLMILWRLWQTSRRERSRLVQMSALAIMGALVGHLVAAIATDGAFGLLTSGALFFLAGTLVQSGQIEETSVHKLRREVTASASTMIQ